MLRYVFFYLKVFLCVEFNSHNDAKYFKITSLVAFVLPAVIGFIDAQVVAVIGLVST